MIGSFHRKNWHPTLIIFGFIVIFQNRDGQTNRQTDKQTDRQTDNTNIYMIYHRILKHKECHTLTMGF